MGRLFRTIIDFLFSKANRELLVFVSFLALAAVFWLIMSLNRTYEQEVLAVVRYVNIPSKVVMTSAETDTLRVTLRDKGFDLLPYVQGTKDMVVDIDFMLYSKSAGSGTVGSSDLRKMVESQMPASANLVSIKPEQLVFYYNFGEKKRVPVEWRGHVVPEQLYFISETISSPDSVTVYADKSRLDSILVAYTENLNYTDFHDTLRVTASLTAIKGVKMVPNRVDLQFITDVLTEERIDGIHVVGVNLPEGKLLRTFPAKVSVSFVTGMKTYQSLTAADFIAAVDYNELAGSSSSQCRVRLFQVPAGISRVRLETDVVDCLIEEKVP